MTAFTYEPLNCENESLRQSPVRFPPDLLEQARRAADADDRSLSSWIRQAVERELRRTA